MYIVEKRKLRWDGIGRCALDLPAGKLPSMAQDLLYKLNGGRQPCLPYADKEGTMKRMLIFVVLMMTPAMANGYTIDGNLDDWGIELSASGADIMHYLDNNLPSGGLDIDYVTEDNADITCNPDRGDYYWYVGPLYSYKNYFDVEAIYFDNDALYAYIAVVTGLPPGGYWGYDPGDIAIDVNMDNVYEYGIRGQKLWNVREWYEAGHPDSNPWKIKSGTEKVDAQFVYLTIDQKTHYVLEARVPLSALGLSANPGDPVQPLRIHWTMKCGNDYLTLEADVNPTPEPATLLLLGSGLLGLGGYAGARRKKIK